MAKPKRETFATEVSFTYSELESLRSILLHASDYYQSLGHTWQQRGADALREKLSQAAVESPRSPLNALREIRKIGYNSHAHSATDTVLACIRIAEEALLEAGQ